MQNASECRIPAGCVQLRQRGDVPVERRDRAEQRRRAARGEQHRQPAVREARLVVLRLDLHVARDHPVRQPEVEEAAERLLRLGRIEREPRRVGVVVDELAAVRPDERRDADDRRLHAEAVHGRGGAAGIGVARADLPAGRVAGECPRVTDHRVPCPVVLRLRDAVLLEEVAVVVDDQARDVLRDAELLALPAERVQRDGVEVLRLERVRFVEPLCDRLDGAPGRELRVVPVVHEEDVGRSAGGDRRREARDQVRTVAGLDELHVVARLLFEVRHDLPVGLDLLGVAEDEEPDGPSSDEPHPAASIAVPATRTSAISERAILLLSG